MYIPILEGVQTIQITIWKSVHIVLKTKLLKINFQDEGQSYATFSIFILTIYR